MLRVLGGPKRLCDGLTRRELLQVGSLGLLGLGLTEWQAPTAARAGESLPSARLPGFGKAKSCILLFLYGSPSQLETFDPKPDAPVEIRGELGSIPSSVPGLNVCERLPRLAQVMDKVTVIRSVSHPYPIHGVAYATTGIPRIDVAMELNPRDPATGRSSARWSITSTAAGRATGPAIADAPQPGPPLGVQQSARRRGARARARTADSSARPMTRSAPSSSARRRRSRARRWPAQVWEDVEPYRGITPESRFQLGSVTQPRPRLTLDRLDRRRTLLEQLEHVRRARRRGGVAILGHRPPSRDGLRPARLAEPAAGVRPRPGAGRDPRPLRHDALRPGGADRTAAGRGRRPVRHRLLGRISAWRAPAGIRTGTTSRA